MILLEDGEDPQEAAFLAFVRRSADPEPLRTQRERVPERRIFLLGHADGESVELGVPGDVDAVLAHALAEQDLARAGRGGEQVVGEVIGQDAIDLLGHPAVVGAQPGLDVPDRHAELVGGERGGEHRVGIALDQHDVGALVDQDRLHAAHDRGHLVGRGSGAHLEVAVGLGQVELLEEHLVHLERVVLAGVEQQVRRAAADARAYHRSHLDDLGPRADDDGDLHAADPPRAGGAPGRDPLKRVPPTTPMARSRARTLPGE